jgi:DNA-binding NtrC family response regulator
MMLGALRTNSGNRLNAPQDLHIGRSCLHRLLKKFNIPGEQAAEEENLSAVKKLARARRGGRG